jgi:hypothetical protein
LAADGAGRDRQEGATPDRGLWRAAVMGRFLYVRHLVCGHAVEWRTCPPDLPLCSGDIACRTCGRVLWCRAFDPWQAGRLAEGLPPDDHWGLIKPVGVPNVLPRWAGIGGRGRSDGDGAPTTSASRRTALVSGFTHLLRLLDQLPSGPAENQVRRSVCELIEGDDGPGRTARVDTLLNSIVQLQQSRALGLRRVERAGAPAIDRLVEALHREVLPMLGAAEASSPTRGESHPLGDTVL